MCKGLRCFGWQNKGKTKKKEAIAENAQMLPHKNYLILDHRGGAKSVGHLIFELHKSPINGVLFV